MGPYVKTWELEGADAQPILGNTHLPDGPARGAVLIVHGFLGYKDYGMFPHLAATLAAEGYIAHRFNLSHNGMDNRVGFYDPSLFQRPDLFKADTWNRQRHDINAVADAVADGSLPGEGMNHIWIGHSRGGISVLRAAAHRAAQDKSPQPAGLITISAPGICCSMPEDAQADLLDKGFAEIKSNRTRQTLHIGRDWLAEQRDDPEDHDVLLAARRSKAPKLFVHGREDPTVHCDYSDVLREACTDAGLPAWSVLIDGADHVFSTPNPMGEGDTPSDQLQMLERVVLEFAQGVFDDASGHQ